MGKLHSRFANTHKHLPQPHFLAGVHFSLFEVFFCFQKKKKNQTSIVRRKRQCDIPAVPLLFIKVLDMQPVPAEVRWESMGKRNRAGSPVDAAEQDRGVGQNADNGAENPYYEPLFLFFTAHRTGLDVSFRRTNRRGLSTQILLIWLEICTTMMSVGDDICLIMPTPGSVCSGSLGRLKTSKTDVSLQTALRTWTIAVKTMNQPVHIYCMLARMHKDSLKEIVLFCCVLS